MPATYLGQVTVGAALPGFSAAFDAVGLTLVPVIATLDGAVATLGSQVTILGNIGDLVIAIGDGILSIKDALRIPVGGDVALQYSAAVQAIANLTASLTNPSAYVQAQISGCQQAIANLVAVNPLLKIQGQIAATLSISLQLQAKVSAIDLALAALDTPALACQVQGAAVRAAADAIDVIVDGLQVATNSLNVALTGFNAFRDGTLATAGFYAFLYTGPLGGLGAAVDAATPSTGVSAAADVYVPIVFVQSSDPLALNAATTVYLG